jgi:hypothetical protein
MATSDARATDLASAAYLIEVALNQAREIGKTQHPERAKPPVITG